MIDGAHVIIYSKDAEADKAFFMNVLKFGHVDVGHGWLIFKLPPAELGVHPVMDNGSPMHQISFMCDDLDATIAELQDHGIEIRGEPKNEGFGITTTVVLPGGVDVMLYEPRHPTAI